MSKQKIKIAFLDFWSDFDKNNNFFTDILSEKYQLELSDDPDYVICSVFGHENLKKKYRNCIKIVFVGENLVADFNSFDYAMGFGYIDYEDRYLRLPLYALYPDDLQMALKKHERSEEEILNKKKFCAYVISNPKASKERDAIIDSISNYKELASGGSYRNNVGGPVKDKISFLSDYRFSLALENSGSSGYTSEKLVQSFAAGTIPIYWGNPRITEEFNKDAFINVRDFENYDSLKDFVVSIYEDDAKYLAMMKAPILNENCDADRILDDEYIQNFFDNIFSQKKGNAYRRNMIYVGKKYQDKTEALNKLLVFLGTLARPILYCRNQIRKHISRNGN